jgi:hypothetical protein
VYCNISDLKRVLLISLADSSKDSHLEHCIANANEIVTGLLKAQGLTVPTAVPQIIANATKYFAAWDFQRQKGLKDAETFWLKADKLLIAYSEMFCRSSVSFHIAKNQPKHRRRISW